MIARSRFLVTSATALAVVALPNGKLHAVAVAADAPPAKTTSLGNWLRMLPDGSVESYSDKVEVGMGTATGLAQFVADELDIPFARVTAVLGDTAMVPDSGGVGGSTSTFEGNFPVRHAAAEMRRILVNAAAKQLGIDASALTVREGVVYAIDDPSKHVAYGALVAALTPDPTFPVIGDGPTTDIDVPAQPKPFSAYKIAGSPIPRVDAAPKAFGRYKYVVDVKVPGMLHGRTIAPPSIGATVVAVDDSSIHGIGDARVVRVQSFVGVVATREWDAIKAARALKVTWSAPATKLPAMAQLADYMWAQKPFRTNVSAKAGNVDAAPGATVEAEYHWPFQSHANMGPGCSVVDAKPGAVTVWSGTQKTHALQKGIAGILKVPEAQVRVIWVSDAGSYGRGGLEESAGAAALLSQAVGRPVRVQSMRSDNTQWGNKAPAIVARLSGKVQNGGISALQAVVRQFNGNEIYSRPDSPGGFLAGQLAGFPNDEGQFEYGQYPGSSGKYEIPNVNTSAELIPPFAPSGSPLRTAHMRDPEGPGTTFIFESFIDELAARAGADAVQFRIEHLKDPRQIDVVRAAATALNWETRPSGTVKHVNAHGQLVGRGVAFAVRGPTFIATVAEVAVNPKTGAVRVQRIACAHDCGFVVNPKSLQGTIEANIIQSISRSLYEQVTFNDHSVTSVDWVTYPIVHMHDVPDEVKVVMMNRPSVPPGGAGEPASRTTAAAIGNAIFDATAVRVRTAPFTPANVLAAMTTAKSA